MTQVQHGVWFSSLRYSSQSPSPSVHYLVPLSPTSPSFPCPAQSSVPLSPIVLFSPCPLLHQFPPPPPSPMSTLPHSDLQPPSVPTASTTWQPKDIQVPSYVALSCPSLCRMLEAVCCNSVHAWDCVAVTAICV